MVLAVSALAEGTSLVRVLVQLRGQAHHDHVEVLDHVRSQPRHDGQGDPVRGQRGDGRPRTGRAGLALRQVTGSPVWDGGASIAIGVLLVVVAVKLGLDSRDFLIGRAADPRELG